MFRALQVGDTSLSMTDLLTQFGPYILAAIAAGALTGWLVRGAHSNRRLNHLCDEWQMKFDETARQRDRFNSENIKVRASIETLQGLVAKHEHAAAKGKTDLESAAEKIKLQAKDLFALGAEREELGARLDNSQNALATANNQIGELEAEFIKVGNFYKGELEKAFDKRKAIAAELEDAHAEHESLSNLLDSARSESNSINKMLAAAQARLDDLDAMEQKVIVLEAENAELRHIEAGTQREIEALQRDVAELEELKVQNRELTRCLQSMESSRKQYETDAQRYRQKAEKSNEASATLRMKLDDVEQSFAEIARQHDEALKVAQQGVRTAPEKEEKVEEEVDDLLQIVGIGKVFQQTLHDLGIYSYRQIASFGASDIARVNSELKEFKGRMEQDDWVGQAKDLLFKKYGETH